jgi:hypothetical protein
MTLVKTFNGVDIEVNEQGKFKAVLKSGAKKESRTLREVEKFITDNAPKGNVKLERFSNYGSEQVTVIGIAPPLKTRNTWSGAERPRLLLDGKNYRGEPKTSHADGWYRENPEVREGLKLLEEELSAATRAFNERKQKLLNSLGTPLTLAEIEALLAESAEKKED